MNRYKRIIQELRQREEAHWMRFYSSCDELGKKGKSITHEIDTKEKTMNEHTFTHLLGDTVSIKVSLEYGVIIARAEYLTSEDSYLIRYQCADGRAVEAWWSESALRKHKVRSVMNADHVFGDDE